MPQLAHSFINAYTHEHMQGIDPCSLDFMVCNAGSLVWHTTRDLDEADAQAQQEVGG
jgi:hypothetical protein